MKWHLVQVSGLLHGARKPPKQDVSVLRGKGNELQPLCDSFSSRHGNLVEVWALLRGWGSGSWGAVSNCRGTSCDSSRRCSAPGTSVRAAFHLATQAEVYLILNVSILTCCNGWSGFVPSKNNIVIANKLKLAAPHVNRHYANSAGHSAGLLLGSLSTHYEDLLCKQRRGAGCCDDVVWPKGRGNSKGLESVGTGYKQRPHSHRAPLMGNEKGSLETWEKTGFVLRKFAKQQDEAAAVAWEGNTRQAPCSSWCRPRGGSCLQNQMSDRRTRSQTREGAGPLLILAPLPDDLSWVCLLCSWGLRPSMLRVTISSMELEDLNQKETPPKISSVMLKWMCKFIAHHW